MQRRVVLYEHANFQGGAGASRGRDRLGRRGERRRVLGLGGRRLRRDALPARLVRRRRLQHGHGERSVELGATSATTTSRRSSSSARIRTGTTTRATGETRGVRRAESHLAARRAAAPGSAPASSIGTSPAALWQFTSSPLLLERLTITCSGHASQSATTNPIPFPFSLIQGWHSPGQLPGTRREPATRPQCSALDGRSTSAASGTGASRASSRSSGSSSRERLAVCTTSAQRPGFTCRARFS